MSDMTTFKLKVVGPRIIHCAGCESAIKFTLSQLPSVQEVKADHRTQTIQVSLTPNEVATIDEVKVELNALGYAIEEAV